MSRFDDREVAKAIFAIGCFIACLVSLTSRPQFYQFFMREAVMWACGQGFVEPVAKPAALIDFLLTRRTDFTCSELGKSPLKTLPAGLHVRMHLYQAALVALSWRIFGVSYVSLTPLLALFYGFYGVACFVLARQYFPLKAATAIGGLMVLSPVSAGALVSFRDFGKAPFMIGAIALMIISIRQTSGSHVVAAAGASGALIGLGFGFRSDVLLLLPLGIVVLGLGVNSAAGWQGRIGGIVALLTAAAIFMAPLQWVRSGAGGSGGFGAMVMEGATEPFREFLRIDSAPYTLGWAYSDELTLSSIAAELGSNSPAWDQSESPPMQGMSQAYTRSTEYLAQWALMFAGDFATRALKSAAWLSGFHSIAQPEYKSQMDPGGRVRKIWTPLTPILSSPLLANPLMPLVGLLGLLALLLKTYTRQPREALVLAILLVALLTYPVVQFSVRHTFHLEILQWMALFSLAMLALQWKQVQSALPKFAALAVTALVVVGAAYWALQTYQDRAIKADLERLLAAATPISRGVLKATSDGIRIDIPVPPQYAALIADRPDAMVKNIVNVGHAHRVVAAADRLAIAIGGLECPKGTFEIKFAYEKRPLTWQPLDHGFNITAPEQAGTSTLVIAPVYYRATQNFAALVVPPGRERCILSIDRLQSGLPGLPIGFTAVLPPQWRSLFFAQAFGNFRSGR